MQSRGDLLRRQGAGGWTLKELLATPDTVRITTPVLPRKTMERVLEIIRKDVAADKVRVDNPTQNLESYFLDVVEKGKAGRSGNQRGVCPARGSRRIFRGGMRKKLAAEKILERLYIATSCACCAGTVCRIHACRGRERSWQR